MTVLSDPAHRLVVFAHGMESGPWGTKILALADVAKRMGFAVDSPDYSHTKDPHARVGQLLKQNPQSDCLVLAGSSMGGYVSAQACAAYAQLYAAHMAAEETEAFPCAAEHLCEGERAGMGAEMAARRRR